MDTGRDASAPGGRGTGVRPGVGQLLSGLRLALPFGGYKESGWGRETCRETMDEYTELKTVVVNLGPTT